MAMISRRTLLSRTMLLAAAAAGAAVGLTKTVHHKVAVPPPAPPAGLLAALNDQQRLLAGYDTAIAARADQVLLFTPLRADIAAHGDALRAALELYPGWRLARSEPSASARPGGTASVTPPVAGTAASLASACGRSAAATRTACTAWPIGEPNAVQVVPLLGSIAACLSTHVAVLS